MNQIFYDAVGNNPIIAAVKNMKDIEVSCTIEEIQVIFILFGDVCSIDRIVKGVKDAGKVAMVHVDLISGLSPKEVSVEYLKEHTEADGIISTKPSLIKKATPIIAGGLITDKEDVMAALSAGAIAVSSTNHQVWKM